MAVEFFDPVDFDPYSHRWKPDPYPIYRALRDTSPVHHAEASDSWTISRFDDVQAVLKDTEAFSSKTDRRRRRVDEQPLPRRLLLIWRSLRALQVWPREAARGRMLIGEDGQVHALMRDIVNRGFTPRRIARWDKRVHEIVAAQMDGLRRRDRFDLVQELAIPLPVTVIAEILGIESERMHDFKRWSDAIIEGGTGSAMDAVDAKMMGVLGELRAYLKPIVRARRARPADDLISTLVQADGDAALSDWEIFLFVLLLLVAGNETTTNLLGNTVDGLLQHRDQLDRVLNDPALVPALVEEGLRWDSPVQFITRQTTREVVLRDTRIPARAHVVVLLGSANRDERRFADPDRLDVDRDTRGHLGFGFGAHFCLGASLARLEARAALEALIPELPGLERAEAAPVFLDSFLIRGRRELPLQRRA